MSSMAENSPTPSDTVTVQTLRSIIGSSISLSEQDRHGCKEYIPQSPNSATILTSEINSQPQDFVVLSGKNFKVKRSILRPEFNAILRSSSANLKESFESISSDISSSRYGCLFDSSSTKVNPPSSSCSSSGSHKQSLADKLALNSTDRRRLQHSNSKIIDSCHDPIQRAFSSSPLAGEELVDDCTSLSLTAPASLMSSTPISSSSGSSQGSGSSHLVRRLLHARSLSQSSAFSEISSPGSSEGYDDAADASAPCYCPPSREMLSPVEVAAAESVRFYWKDKQGIHLFIAHDNPQLGKTVHSFIVCSKGGPNSSAASAGMQCMLEFKDQSEPSQKTVFLLGTIIYSGPFSGIEDAEVLQPRGSACLVVGDIRAVRGDVKQLATRTPRGGGDIVEIDLLSDHVPAGFAVPLSSTDELKALLQSCKEKVDVILDPYHCSGDDDAAQQWFPYWEGTRRMAPQFRSKGIGYIRLGDDMSQYGVAFLSLDAGATYLDDGATSIVAKGARGGLQLVDHHAKTSLPSTTHRLGAKHNSLQQSAAMRDYSKAAQDVGLMDSNAAPTTIGDATKEGSMWRLKEALQGLKDSSTHSSTSDKPTSLKWNERSELLVSIASQLRELSMASSSSSSSSTPEEPVVSTEVLSMHVNTFTELVLLLTDIVTKKVNPQMLSSSMLCLRALQCGGEGLWSHSHCSVPWRHLVLESIHLLRSNNKHVQECARDALTHLYTAKSITLPLLEGMLDEVIVGSRVAANHLHPHPHLQLPSNNNNSKTLLHSAANTSRVIQWLDSLIVAELDGLIADDGYIPVSVGMDRSDREATAGRTRRLRRIGVGCLLRRCGQLLAHREEVTRESSTALTTHLLALDVLQNMLLTDDADDAEQLSELSTSLSLASSANSTDEKKQQHMMQSLIMHVVTANIRPIIADIAATNGRYYKKIVGSLSAVLSRYSGSLSSSTADRRRDRGVDRREEAPIQVGSCDEVKTDSSPGGDHHRCELLLSAASGQTIQKSMMQRSLSSIKRRSRTTATTRLQQGSGGAVSCTDGSAAATAVAAGTDASLQELLSRDWFEAKLLLRRRPQSDAEWDEQVKARAVVCLTAGRPSCSLTLTFTMYIYLAFFRPSRELRSSSATSPPCLSLLAFRVVLS